MGFRMYTFKFFSCEVPRPVILWPQILLLDARRTCSRRLFS